MQKRVVLLGIIVENTAAVEQLMIWGERVGVPVIKQKMGADPASVAYATLSSAVANNADIVVLDAPADVISTLSGKIGMLKGVSVKALYAKAPQEQPF